MRPYINEEKKFPERSVQKTQTQNQNSRRKKIFTKITNIQRPIHPIFCLISMNPFKTLPHKYAVSCLQSVLIRENKAEQNIRPYMYIRTNQSVSTLSAIRQQTVGKLTIKLNANKEPELINYSKKTRKSND